MSSLRRIQRETLEEYKGRPMMLELVQDRDGKVIEINVWPKGTRDKQTIAALGGWQAAQNRHNPIPVREVGMAKRRPYEHGESLFICKFPTGIAYCDRRREENGDYAKVAFLLYSTLELEVCKPKSDLLDVIRADAEQYEKGQVLEVSGSGQTITLGSAIQEVTA